MCRPVAALTFVLGAFVVATPDAVAAVPVVQVLPERQRLNAPLAVPGQELVMDVHSVQPGSTDRIPPDAVAVYVIVWGNTDDAGEVALHACGVAPDRSRLVVHAAVETSPSNDSSNSARVPLNGGQFCFTTFGSIQVDIAAVAYESATGSTGGYVAVAPTRVYDPASGDPSLRQDTRALIPGAPSDATAVVFEVTSLGLHHLQLSACSANTFLPDIWVAIPDARTINRYVVPLGAADRLCAFGLSPIDVITVVGYVSPSAPPAPIALRAYRGFAPPKFLATDPQRLVDTRQDPGAPVIAGTTFRLPLGTVAPAGTTAVALNVTVTEPAAGGFVTVYPCSDPVPVASNVNYASKQTVANATVVGLGADGAVCFFTKTTTHLVVDLAGWYSLAGGDGFAPTDPRRLFDTRDRGAPVPRDGTFEFDAGAFVDTDATALVINLTVVDPLNPGYLTAYGCSNGQPLASSVNFDAGQTVANLVTVRVPADHHLCVYTHSQAHVVADLAGWFSPSSKVGFYDLSPSRLFDTRIDGGAVPGGSTSTLRMLKIASAWMMNLTVDTPVDPGFATVHPCGGERPQASNVNYVRGITVPNLVVVKPSIETKICFYAHTATQLIADLAGYYSDHFFYASVEV